MWLAVAVLAGAAAAWVALPAWSRREARRARDTNTERYLAWRGRAAREPRAPKPLPDADRWRLLIGAVLATVAVVALIGFFVVS